MTVLEIDKANEQMRSLVIVMNSHEYKSGTYLYIRDKMDYFCEFMALFGYEWCEDGFFFESDGERMANKNERG